MRDHRIKASTETIERSLVGTWRAEHLFTLKQSRDLYRMYQQQIVACDREVESAVSRFEPRVDPAEKPWPPDGKRRHAHKRRTTAHSASAFELRTEAYKVCGVDVTQIPGLETMVFPLFSDVGRDLSAWPTADHCASWLGLCPDNDITGVNAK